MPRIVLKHKSPEYEDRTSKTTNVRCEMPGCSEHGDHKAPKHRGLDDYYFFCFEHVREYNRAWDFFSGMSEKEVQSHMEKSLYGDRPTWIYTNPNIEDDLKQAAEKTYFYSDERKTDSRRQESNPPSDSTSPEHEAMAIMGLSPPVTLEEIKTRYKILAKKYHPDLNRDNPEAEELLKKVNMSYTILKLAFEEYKRLPDHKF